MLQRSWGSNQIVTEDGVPELVDSLVELVGALLELRGNGKTRGPRRSHRCGKSPADEQTASTVPNTKLTARSVSERSEAQASFSLTSGMKSEVLSSGAEDEIRLLAKGHYSGIERGAGKMAQTHFYVTWEIAQNSSSRSKPALGPPRDIYRL